MDRGIEEWSALGLWASASATFTCNMSLRIASKSNKPKLKVNVINGFLVGVTNSDLRIIITGTNAGVMPVNLVSSDIQLPRKLFKKQGGLIFPMK